MNNIRLWLQLVRAKGVGSAKASKLLDAFGSIEGVFRASNAQLRSAGLAEGDIEALQKPDGEAIDGDLAWLELPNNHVITLDAESYPAQLKEISRPPVLLFVHGDPQVLALPQLAIVGSRNPTAVGKQNAAEFAATFAQNGLTVTSGLALGVDAYAHRGALNGGGLTIAVCGTGLDRVYPARNKALAHEIAVEGALISEYPLGTPVLPENFPRRNRIVSGLAMGSLVVEAAQRSGSLITARYASEQGREVFAIPGSIQNPLARGCHSLIRQGAKLVETAEHVLEELAPQLPQYKTALTSSEPVATGSPLLAGMGFEPVTADELSANLGWDVEKVNTALIEHELSGEIAMLDDGRYLQIKR